MIGPKIEDETDATVLYKSDNEIQYDWTNKDVTLKFKATDLGSGMNKISLRTIKEREKFLDGEDV